MAVLELERDCVEKFHMSPFAAFDAHDVQEKRARLQAEEKYGKALDAFLTYILLTTAHDTFSFPVGPFKQARRGKIGHGGNNTSKDH